MASKPSKLPLRRPCQYPISIAVSPGLVAVPAQSPALPDQWVIDHQFQKGGGMRGTEAERICPAEMGYVSKIKNYEANSILTRGDKE